ncbi:MAG: penicillin-binding protein, partial [Clostridium sp.]|nr:penicillin-binding protein [Clostridium sp.]
MFEDFREYITDLAKRLITSRLFLLAVIFFGMFSILVVRLFRLQILEGEKYQEDYVSMAEKVIRTSGTRGNIYDRNGNILAGNRLAYNISIQDVGAYRGDAEINSMLFRLIRILERHNTQASCSLELGLDDLGNVVYTCESADARKRFLRDYYGLKNVSELDDEAGKYPSDITA